MSAFVETLGVLFADPNISVEIWHRDSEGQFTRARGILRRPDEITEFGSARLLSETTRIDVQVKDIPDPRPQEQILIGEDTFLIQGEPRRDRERLIWCQRQSKSEPKGSAKCCHFGFGIISVKTSASIRAAALVI